MPLLWQDAPGGIVRYLPWVWSAVIMSVTYSSANLATPSSGTIIKTTQDGTAHVQHVNIDNPADDSTAALTTIDYAHHEIHEGDAYFAVYSALKDTAGTIEVRIQTPDTTKWAHMTIVVDFAIAGTAELWLGTTKTHNATNAITPMNRNHNSTSTSGLTICHTPDGAEGAAASLTQYVGASAVGGRVSVGGSAASRNEFILDQNNDYLIRATSRADGNAMSIILDWYEHTDVA